MPERDGYIPGVPCWIDTSQPDPEAAVDFYSGLFGWEFEDVMPPESEAKYFIGRLRGGDVAAVGSIPEGAPPMAMWNTYIWVESADETASKVADAGGKVLMEPFDVMDAGRMAVFADPEGADVLRLAGEAEQGRADRERGGLPELQRPQHPRRGGREVASTARCSAGRRWRSDGGAEMWTLPGYGDHLEECNPDLRKQMAEGGAPAGFEDVVASINPIPDDQPDVPAHWSVTFAVDDADATAAKAAELGGKVVVPPFDAPWVRMTVLADPQGATFIASKFVPENRDLATQTGATTSTA